MVVRRDGPPPLDEGDKNIGSRQVHVERRPGCDHEVIMSLDRKRAGSSFSYVETRLTGDQLQATRLVSVAHPDLG
ncbi:hypothetical protein D3C87_2068340 [compost metagenome]